MSEMTLHQAMGLIGQFAAETVARSIIHDCGDRMPMAKIRELQTEMATLAASEGLPLCPTPVDEMFADGLYARKYAMPEGQMAVTKTHRKKHFIVVVGDCTIWTDEAMKRLSGFHCFITHPGTKRVILAHADTVFITFHATQETDPAAIEAELIEPEDLFEEYTL